MPQAFTQQQMQAIRRQLFESACRHAVKQGVRKTSLETLTADAGISKSTFYKFYQSKEALFFEVACHFEADVISQMQRSLAETIGLPNRERTAQAVNAVFARVAELNILNFFQENMPLLLASIPTEMAQMHLKTMEEKILDLLAEAHIRFTQPPETVAAAIHILYQSIQYLEGQERFPDALRLLVLGTCDQMVEA